MIREKTFLNPVDAELKAFAIWRRRNGVGPRLHLAVLVLCNRRDELAGSERKALHLIDHKLKVVALGYFRNAFLACKSCCIKLSCQGISLFAGKFGPRAGHRTIICSR